MIAQKQPRFGSTNIGTLIYYVYSLSTLKRLVVYALSTLKVPFVSDECLLKNVPL